MAAASTSNGFEDWLGKKLISVNPEVDTDVFVSYLIGILESDCTTEERKESLQEVLEDVVESDKEQVCEDIIKQWDEYQGGQNEKDLSHGKLTIDEKLSDLLGKQDLLAASVKTKELSEEDKARKAAKEAILAQYSHANDSDESSSDELDPSGASGSVADNSLLVNSNREDVKKLEQEKREKSKLEHEKKKDKDKSDREAQKQKKVDRKETEKKRTQKGERRR